MEWIFIMKHVFKSLGVWLLVATVVQAAEVASVFSDHMVLQQEIPAPVWGTGAAGENVTVTFAGQTKSTKADAKGEWMIRLDPLTASAKPGVLTIRAAGGEKTISDVLVGEVWIASGQSNMALRIAFSAGTAEQKAPDPMIRLLQIPLNPSAMPLKSVNASWEPSDGKSLGTFSAVAYFFAKHLSAARKVPVGIINSSVGGTPARAWTTHESMADDPRLKHQTDRIVEEMKKYDPAKAQADYQAAMAKFKADSAAPAVPNKKLQQPKKPQSPAEYQHSPAALYNGMIAPLVPMAIRGAIWYQGEADSKAASEYRMIFPALIHAWRKSFGHELSFLFVQIAPQKEMSPEIRDAQLFTWRTVPKTAMAVITDYGNAENIHPKDKDPVGARLALAARAIAYGEKIEYSGPVFDKLKINGKQAVLSFQHIGDGLMVKGDKLTGFEISGDGNTYVSANAVIAGDTVVVTSDAVASPVAVRFGWANVPETNLFNKNDLPATPFRTSDK